MIRKFKTLGLALVAVLALSAVVASAAMAEGEYTAGSYPASGTAHSAAKNDVFTTSGGTVECTSSFAATLSEPSNHLTVVPTYTNCVAFGFAHATVTMDGCDYTFETPVNTGTDKWNAPVEVVCPDTAGGRDEITITAGNCEVRVPTQTPSGHVGITLNTAATPNDVSVQATITGIDYTIVKDGFLCPFDTAGKTLPVTETVGTYKQISPVTFHASGKSVSVS
ncbi:MAG TPA: hypothetical protein VLI94_03765 [Solirubrobacterales bacterium]|nr:hypothetical protein [Solirubrobacterales bacterium]